MVAFLQVLITKGPDVAIDIINAVKKQNPTVDDLIALFDAIAEKSYDDFMKEAGVPVAPVIPAIPKP
jgi:hypothetical protein